METETLERVPACGWTVTWARCPWALGSVRNTCCVSAACLSLALSSHLFNKSQPQHHHTGRSLQAPRHPTRRLREQAMEASSRQSQGESVTQ